MPRTLAHVTYTSFTGGPRNEHDLCARVQAEFREMPGMRLTLSQASRLFSIEPSRCQYILEALVRAGQLATDGTAFASAKLGRHSA